MAMRKQRADDPGFPVRFTIVAIMVTKAQVLQGFLGEQLLTFL